MLGSLRKLFQRDAAPPAATPAAATPPAATPPAADWRQRGNDALAAGDLATAAACYLEGTQPPPGQPIAWLNLGYVQLERGEHDAARESLRSAEALLPQDAAALPDVWALMGRERQERQQWGAAAAAYRRVLARLPSHEGVWRELGQVNELQGKIAEAEEAYRRAVALRGDFELALRDLARLLMRLERDREALPFIERLLALPRVHPETRVLHANALGQWTRLADALAALDAALQHGEDEFLLMLRATVLTALKRPAEALASHDAILARDPDHVDSLVDSARALGQLGRFEEATGRIDRALAREPQRVEAVGVKAMLLMLQLRCREALALLEQPVSRLGATHPDLVFLASFLHLLLGEYERGWPGFEARWRLRHRGVPNRQPDFGAPQWAGEPLAGRSILLYCEQGLGDSIQFLRFLPQVAARAGKVWLRVQPPLLPVLGELPPRCELLRAGALPPLDFACPLMSLGAVLGTTLDTLPAPVAYLHAPPERIAHWQRRLGPRQRRFRVGVAWSGNPDQANDHNRSMPLQALRAAAMGVDDVEFISLQKDLRAADEATLRAWPQLRHFGPELESFGDTAALACLVDVVISVDTSVAHLAGALGRPVSVLLTACPTALAAGARQYRPGIRPPACTGTDAGRLQPPLAAALADIARRADPAPAS